MIVITEDAKYDPNAPSSRADTTDRALIVSTQTGKAKLEFTSLEVLKNAPFEIMLLHAWREWYRQEGDILSEHPYWWRPPTKPLSPITRYIGALREPACSIKPWPIPGLPHSATDSDSSNPGDVTLGLLLQIKDRKVQTSIALWVEY